MQSIQWDDFRLVRAIAEHRALAGAAEILDVNNSTVFRRLNSLEEQLGVRLFERARSGYLLTSAGEEMVRLANTMGESIIDFERRIAGQDVRPSGELHVTTTDTMFADLVAPMFEGFRAAYPDILLDFVIDNRPLNLSRRDADVAIRASIDPPDTLVGRRIGVIKWHAYASTAWLRENKIDPMDKQRLLQPDIPWLGIGDPLHNTASAQWIQTHIPARNIVGRINAVSGIMAGIEARLGIGMVPCFIGDLRRGVTRVDFSSDNKANLWVLTHPDLKRAARVRAFLDYFGAELMKKRRLVEGECPAEPDA